VRIVEREHFCTIEEFFPKNVILGFTKKSIKGLPPFKDFKSNKLLR
jgi:hypothetical protein